VRLPVGADDLIFGVAKEPAGRSDTPCGDVVIAFDVLWAMVMFIAVRSLASRLLGVGIGVLGAGLAAGFAIAAGAGVQAAFDDGAGHGSIHDAVPYLVFGGLSLLITMAVVAAVGLLSGPSVTPIRAVSVISHPLRNLRARVDRMSRYVGLLWLGARYGLGPVSGLRRHRDHQQVGVALRGALQDAGGIFIKFGQLLSARTDLVPAAIANELSSLQDHVPALPTETITMLVETELGRPLRSLLTDFDATPLAAASIAQVHQARLPTGERVIVKAQRPDIERLIARDLDILQHLASSLEDRATWARRLGSVSLANGFARNLSEELDFRIEARNARAISDGPIRVPHVYPSLTTQRVLVEEWIDGRPLRAATALLEQDDRTKLARCLLDGMLEQIFRIGVFHADPHAGNVLITDTCELVLLDFGSVGRLNSAQRLALTQALVGLTTGRATTLTDALLDLADGHADVDVERLERALERFLSRTLAVGAQLGVQTLNDLLDVAMRCGLRLDPQLAGVFRALATLDGTLRQVDPTFNLITETGRYVSASHLIGLPRPADVGADIAGDLMEMLPALRKLPRRIDKIARALEHGDFSVRLRPPADHHDTSIVGRYVNRLVLAFVSASIGLVSALLLGVGQGPHMLGTRLDIALGYLGLSCATVLGLRVISDITRDRR
jgi:ubiquinone biosynthesis protein